MILNIIWDVDGTLFDTYPAFAKAFRLAVNDLGQDAPLEWITTQARVSIDHCLQSLSKHCSLETDIVEEKFHHHYQCISPFDQPPFEGVSNVCRFISSRGGKNLIVTHRRTAGMLALLESFNMRQYFSDWITADDNFPRKPDASAFLTLLSKHKLIAAETLAIGDRDIDILAGQAAGLSACLIGDSLSTCKPEITITDFSQLLIWVANQ